MNDDDVIYLEGATQEVQLAPLERMLYKVNEVAYLLNISRSQLYLLMAAGSIKAVKIGSSVRFTKKQIEDFINSLREAILDEDLDENSDL
jgi:excisionase family DNA binding protein